jgi:hypothetical protein
VANYEFLRKIILDRNKLFILKFWQILTAKIEIKTKFSIVFYPQTDRQTERINQNIE